MRRIVLYEQQQDGKFHCVLEVWDGERFKEVLSAHNEKSIHAQCDVKRNAILKGLWIERVANESKIGSY